MPPDCVSHAPALPANSCPCFGARRRPRLLGEAPRYPSVHDRGCPSPLSAGHLAYPATPRVRGQQLPEGRGVLFLSRLPRPAWCLALSRCSINAERDRPYLSDAGQAGCLVRQGQGWIRDTIHAETDPAPSSGKVVTAGHSLGVSDPRPMHVRLLAVAKGQAFSSVRVTGHRPPASVRRGLRFPATAATEEGLSSNDSWSLPLRSRRSSR